ncbi:MAG: DnaJ domain-containing protein, partial [Deltaproteobacteria bacterium]|nr:DnaJ domain-containing protein [Deltaproteobacteria bacterium]
AEPEVIDAAYHRLAAKYHPDHNPGRDAEERMKSLNEAYSCLSDPGRRAEYDQMRRMGQGHAGPDNVRTSRGAGWFRLLAPLLFLGVTIGGFRVSPRIGLVMAAGFAIYALMRRSRR